MLKKIRKVFAFALALTMLMGMSTAVFAAETDNQSGDHPFAEEMTSLDNVSSEVQTLSEGIQPLVWPGDGPAPQVTRLEIADIGTLNSNGNLCIVLKVYGYGRGYTTFDGREIDYVASEPFIISGTGADGFYYLYDCGVKPAAGSYVFYSKFTSTNPPHKVVEIRYPFTLE